MHILRGTHARAAGAAACARGPLDAAALLLRTIYDDTPVDNTAAATAAVAAAAWHVDVVNSGAWNYVISIS